MGVVEAANHWQLCFPARVYNVTIDLEMGDAREDSGKLAENVNHTRNL